MVPGDYRKKNSHTLIELETFKLYRIVILIVIVIVMVIVPRQMDRNDLRDNCPLDLHQNFTEYTSSHFSSYSIKIMKKVHYFFSRNF